MVNISYNILHQTHKVEQGKFEELMYWIIILITVCNWWRSSDNMDLYKNNISTVFIIYWDKLCLWLSERFWEHQWSHTHTIMMFDANNISQERFRDVFLITVRPRRLPLAQRRLVAFRWFSAFHFQFDIETSDVRLTVTSLCFMTFAEMMFRCCSMDWWSFIASSSSLHIQVHFLRLWLSNIRTLLKCFLHIDTRLFHIEPVMCGGEARPDSRVQEKVFLNK